jgi:hypothetical protein
MVVALLGRITARTAVLVPAGWCGVGARVKFCFGSRSFIDRSGFIGSSLTRARAFADDGANREPGPVQPILIFFFSELI